MRALSGTANPACCASTSASVASTLMYGWGSPSRVHVLKPPSPFWSATSDLMSALMRVSTCDGVGTPAPPKAANTSRNDVSAMMRDAYASALSYG